MRFSAISQVLLLSLAAFARAEDNCDAGPEEAPFAPGRVGGEAFPTSPDDQMGCESRWKAGEVLTGMKAWSSRTQIEGVQFKWGDNWGKVIGKSKGGRSWYAKPENENGGGTWDKKQPVEIQIWNKKSKVFNGPGRIKIMKADATRDVLFEVGIGDSEVEDHPLQDINQGVGFILGVKTRARDHVSSIEVKMQRSRISSAALASVNAKADLDDWNNKKTGIEDLTLVETYYENPNEVGGPNLTYTFTNSIKRGEEKSITKQGTNSWLAGVEVKVKGGISIPFLAEAGVEISTKFEYTRTEMEGESTTWKGEKDLTNTQGSGPTSNMLPPQKAAHCKFQAVRGKFDSEFTGDLEVTLEDDSKYTYEVDGEVRTVGWAKSKSSCKEIELKDVPFDASIGNTQEPKKGDEARRRAVEFRA